LGYDTVVAIRAGRHRLIAILTTLAPYSMGEPPMSKKHSPSPPEPLSMIALLTASIKGRLKLTSGAYKIAVHHLWDDRFRVNVFVGADFVSVAVAQSFFVIADVNGSVVSSTPEMPCA
jgi:hypothetical protein